MVQNAELSKVKEQIRKFLQMTTNNGASESEAMFAAARVGKLLEQYNLSMDEVDLRDEPCLTQTVKLSQKRLGGVTRVGGAIGKFCDCKVWTGRSGGRVTVNFFGMESDVAMAVYLLGVIERAMEAEAKAFQKSDDYIFTHARRGATMSFKRGLISRVASRLNEMKNALDAETAAQRSTGRGLIVLKGKLVEQEFETEQKRRGLNLRTVYSSSSVSNSNAFNRGREAGERVNLSRPVGGGARGPLAIGHRR